MGLIVGLAVLGSQAAAKAQGLPGAGAATAPASPAVGAADSAPSTPAPAPAIARPRRPASSSFQRVVTTRRTTVSPTSRTERATAPTR